MFKARQSIHWKRLCFGSLLAGVFTVGGACGGASSDGQTTKTPVVASLPACNAGDVCTDLGTCLLTSKEHLDAFNCRACSDEAVKACEDPKSCPVTNASAVEAFVCRAIRKEMACKDATTMATEAWRKDGEPPFLDEPILRRAIAERYTRQAKATLACPAEPASDKTAAKP
jgi:hypothetical protein